MFGNGSWGNNSRDDSGSTLGTAAAGAFAGLEVLLFEADFLVATVEARRRLGGHFCCVCRSLWRVVKFFWGEALLRAKTHGLLSVSRGIQS
jgi:hypothetical protein